ncbi:MAG: hypothetical protein VYD80_01495, partial [Candidatus Thermoplasmatota archaeon]|nr:hypothetical protein [Candidatus Thermoplasmatota archaeon]
ILVPVILVTKGPIILPVKFPSRILMFLNGKNMIIKQIEIRDQIESQVNPIMKRKINEIMFIFFAPIEH